MNTIAPISQTGASWKRIQKRVLQIQEQGYFTQKNEREGGKEKEGDKEAKRMREKISKPEWNNLVTPELIH